MHNPLNYFTTDNSDLKVIEMEVTSMCAFYSNLLLTWYYGWAKHTNQHRKTETKLDKFTFFLIMLVTCSVIE